MTSIAMTDDAAPQGASLRGWLSVFGCMVGALIAVLDIQITNSSLPQIEGGIGTGSDNGTWISTSYLIGEIIMIPLTDYLSRVFSFRRFLIGNLILFLIFSMLCAFATSLTEMIIWRGLQGFSGGVMIPMAFTRVLTTLPKHQQPIGLAAFAMTATFGPSIGPTIGGYLTENYGWQYIFFVNIVPGALMLGLLYPTLERTRMNLALLREGDWLGIAFMVVGLASLQTVLDEGNQDDWFGSPYIVHLSIVAAVSLAIFVFIELVVEKPAVRLRLLLGRNFALGTIANVLVGFALFGSVYLLPTYLSSVQGYNAEQTGLVLAWVGLPQLLIIPFLPLLQKHFDARAIVCVGLAIFAASCFMNTHLSFDDSGDQFITTNIIRAVGQALVIAPLAGIATMGLPRELSGSASGLFNMLRSLGGAVGTAVLATVLIKREQFHSNIIGQSVTPYGNTVEQFLFSMQQYFLQRGAGTAEMARHQAEILLGKLVAQQSLIMAFSDTFYVLCVVLVVAMGSVLMTRKNSAVWQPMRPPAGKFAAASGSPDDR
jgi:DHA2 family multidrug resistance protein